MLKKISYKFLLPTIFLMLLALVSTSLVLSDAVHNLYEKNADEKISDKMKELNNNLTTINNLMLEQVNIGMSTIKNEAQRIGEPNINGTIEFNGKLIPNLRFGNENAANNFRVVDKVKSIAGGTATIFVKVGVDFLRISTNVIKPNNERAIGTLLDPNGKAIQEIRNKKAFYGFVNILENPYLTGYEPILDAQNNLIGIYYTGYPLSSLAAVGRSVEKSRIFEKGFVALIDEKNNIVYNSDIYSNEELAKILEDENFAIDWILSEQVFDEWNYKIIAAVPDSEINSYASAIAKDVILYGFIFFAGLTLVITLIVFRLILKPVKSIQKTALDFADGNSNSRVSISSNDELGSLGNSLNQMIEKIQLNISELKKKEEHALHALEEAEKAKNESNSQKEYFASKTKEMLNEMEKFASGDLSVSLKIDHNDDVGKLFSGFNKAASEINNLIVELRNNIDSTVNASNQISSSSEEIAAGAQQQSAQSSEIAAAIQEMTSTIISTSKNSTIAAQAAKQAGTTAKESSSKVEETKEGMKRIVRTSETTEKIVLSLTSKTEQIGEIAEVIDDIADQTNLLALNAAIEAARAGDQGRGFAVVADEVKKLAERTSKATSEIAETIKGIQIEVKEANNAMKESKESVNVGMSLTNELEKYLLRILSESDKVLEMIEQVATASEEQSATAEQIGQNIESINSVTAETAQGTTDVARAAENLLGLTDGLQKLISNFKVKNEFDQRLLDKR